LQKGYFVDFFDWLYHKECVAKAHPIFAGLQARGIMDWDYYGPMIQHYILKQLTQHPTADRLLLNLIADGQTYTSEPPAPLPANWEQMLAEIEYNR